MLALLVGASVSSAYEVTGAGVSTAAAGPALQLFGVPLAAALWLLAGVVAASVGLVASRRPRPVRSVPTAAVAPVDGARA
ncbi:hypothetical protein GCM10009818_03790 [Nakamurella flavida]